VGDATIDRRDDAALAARIVAGADADAEADLCRRLLPRIRAYGLRHLREDAAASDLAQHVVVIVLEALRENRVADLADLPAFVMGTCRNTVFEWRRTERRRGALLEKFGASFAAAVEPASVLSLDRERLAHCLGELASRERAIVALTYFGERDPAELAEELAMTLGSVRVARHRALARLHECMTRGETREGAPS